MSDSGRTLHVALLLLFVVLAAAPRTGAAEVTVAALRTEYKVNPIGIDVRHPRFSWQLVSSGRGVVQTAYRIRVADSPSALGNRPLWDTGRVASDASIHRVYEGPALRSATRYYWQVRVWDGAGRASAWSEPAFWETGLLEPTDWRASWIGPADVGDPSKPQPAPLLRKEFRVDGEVRSARAYVSALGLYEMVLNGKIVGDQVFTPGWTSYDTRVQYQTYDITSLLARGENAVGVTLGDGWYRGYLAWGDKRNIYGDRVAVIARIQITYTNGRQQLVVTDTTWKASTGPILMSEIYHGETYDARLEKPGWTQPGYDDSGWGATQTIDKPKSVLIAPVGPPVRRIQEITPVKVLRTPAGETVYDMGQNMVGRVRLRVQGPRGTQVTLRHAEVLDGEGNFYTANLRKAAQTVRYTLKGEGEEVYEPHFTFQGFRYVAVDGLPGEPTLDRITGIVIHSDITPTGRFETSNPLINQLQHNIVWGQKGNFLDVPTDCPQRDERLGWTGDAQVFASTAAFNADVAGFFTKWLADLRADQKPDGTVPHVIPDVLTRGEPTGGGATGWADAAVIVPWTMYVAYGDRRILEQSYPSMQAWVAYMRKQAGERYIWSTGQHFGDWLAYATTRSDYPGATTDKDLIATAFFAHSTSLLARVATTLGKTEDAREYEELVTRITDAFVREFVTPNGRLASNTQTAYVLALSFDLLPESMRATVVERLVDDVRRFGMHLTTGFLGTPHLCPTLSRFGQLDVAYALLNQETYPSWLYPVKMGATTIWERWDGIKPDGTFQDPGMNSFNHYAYGAIGSWMYSVVAGITADPDSPGYKLVRIQPRPGGGLTHAAASLQSMYGEIASAWKREDGRFSLDVTVPPNTRATIRLPNAREAEVTEGGSSLATGPGITAVRQDGNDVVVEAGSGTYRFAWPVSGETR